MVIGIGEWGTKLESGALNPRGMSANSILTVMKDRQFSSH